MRRSTRTATSANGPCRFSAPSSDDPLVRIEAACALSKIDVDNPPPLASLITRVKHREEYADRALLALGDIGPRAQPAVPAILDALKDPFLFTDACGALVQIDITSLLEPWKSFDRDSKERIFELLRNKKMDDRSVPLLIEALGSDEWRIVDWAIAQLKAIGPGAAASIPALQRIVDHLLDRSGSPWEVTDDDERLIATLEALGSLGAVTAPRLLEVLLRSNKWFQERAIDAIGRLGPAAAPAIPTLLERLRHRPVRAQVSAAYTLGRIGPAAVSGLTAALADPSEDVRCLAAFALGRIGPEAKPALEALRSTAANDADKATRGAAERAIERITAGVR